MPSSTVAMSEPDNDSGAVVAGAAAGGSAMGLLLVVLLATYVCRGRSRRRSELREPESGSHSNSSVPATATPRSEYGAAPPVTFFQAHAYGVMTTTGSEYDDVDSVRRTVSCQSEQERMAGPFTN
jgi:hypothetical protein